MTREEIINALQNDKMMPFIQPDQLAKIVDFVSENYKPSLPDGLEEAAKNRVTENGRFPISEFEELRIRDIKFGAEWQKKQDDLETADLLAIAHLQGMEQQKSNMLEEAVDGLVEELYNDGESQCTVGVGTYFKPGEEVYVIKKED